MRIGPGTSSYLAWSLAALLLCCSLAAGPATSPATNPATTALPPLKTSADLGLVPVPNANDIAKASQLVREIYKLPPKIDARGSTAVKLLTDARGSAGEDLSARYVMLTQAGELASAVGDLKTAMSAVDDLGSVFDTPTIELRLDLLQRMRAALNASPNAADLTRAASEAALATVDDACRQEQFDAAKRAAQMADSYAVNTRNAALLKAVRERLAKVQTLAAEYGRADAAAARLRTAPDDPVAKAAVGRYLCAIRGDWLAGLPLLAQSSEPAVKSVATLELAGPTDAKSVIAVADGWWALAEKEVGPVRDALRAQAGKYYSQVASAVTGLEKTKVETRLKELTRPFPAEGIRGRFYVAIDDVATVFVNGKQFQAFKIGRHTSDPITLKPGDLVAVNIANKKAGRRFQLAFASDDGQVVASIKRTQWRDMTGTEMAKLTAVAVQKSTKLPVDVGSPAVMAVGGGASATPDNVWGSTKQSMLAFIADEKILLVAP